MKQTNADVFTGTAAALGTIKGTQGKSICFKYATSGSETVSVTGTVKAAVASGKIMFYNPTTGALHSTTDMGNGTYHLPYIPTEDLIFAASGSSDTKTLTFLIGQNE